MKSGIVGRATGRFVKLRSLSEPVTADVDGRHVVDLVDELRMTPAWVWTWG